MLTREKFFAYWLGRVSGAAGAPITQGEAVRFLYDMHDLELLYHTDDDPAEIICAGGGALFTAAEAVALGEAIIPAMRSAGLVEFTCLSDISLRMPGVSANVAEYPFIYPAWQVGLHGAAGVYAGWLKPDNGEWRGVLLDKPTALKALADDKAFRVIEDEGDLYVYEIGGEATPDVLEPKRIQTTQGEVVAYDMAPLCWCWVARECAEANPAVWQGYAPHVGR